MFGVPFGVLSVNQMEVSAKWYDKYNPLSSETVDKFNSIVNTVYKVFEWFLELDSKIIKMSTDLLAWVYETLTKVVLHTPTFLFDSDWFKESTVTFTGLSVAMVIVLTMFEGLKWMSGGFVSKSNKTEVTRMLKRFPLVLIGSALAPSAFYYTFKGINYLTNLIVDFGKANISEGLSYWNYTDISFLQLISLIGFDIAILTMLIPVLLSNFRRWFDILSLGVCTPLALACWMFKPHSHLFTMWWTHLKKCALTQLTYGVFILIIGTLIFGTKLSTGWWDIMIQMGIVIGGLSRMNNPPSIVSRNVDKGSSISTMFNGASRVIKPFSPKFAIAKAVMKGYKGVTKSDKE